MPPKAWSSGAQPKTASPNAFAPSMSRVCSSFQFSDPGSLTSSAPVWRPACQTPTKPAAGWVKNAIRPASMMSIGSTTTVAPASAARPAAASASSVAT